MAKRLVIGRCYPILEEIAKPSHDAGTGAVACRPSEGAQFAGAQPDLWDGDELIEQDGSMTDLITRRAVEFINHNATKPFFIDESFNARHSPTQRPDHPVGSPAPGNNATRADYAAVMERVDRGVGEILQALRSRGLEKNTIVIFTK